MKQKIQLSESQLRKLIKESVKKAIMNEISSDMIYRAHNKFAKKYGIGGTDRDNLEKDEHGNPLHPKDKKPVAAHFRDFDDALKNAKYDEQFDDPIKSKAMKIWGANQDSATWGPSDEIDFNDEGGRGDVLGVLSVDGWSFNAYGYGHDEGGIIVPDEISEVDYENPYDEPGSFRP